MLEWWKLLQQTLDSGLNRGLNGFIYFFIMFLEFSKWWMDGWIDGWMNRSVFFFSSAGSPHIWHPWGVRPPPKCRHHLPKQTCQGRTRHYSEHPTKGQLQRRRRDQGGDCGSASRWHAGETASWFCTIWGKASDWATMMQQNFVWLMESSEPNGSKWPLLSGAWVLRGYSQGWRIVLRSQTACTNVFSFFKAHKCSHNKLQVLMKHTGINWLLRHSYYLQINKAAGKNVP